MLPRSRVEELGDRIRRGIEVRMWSLWYKPFAPPTVNQPSPPLRLVTFLVRVSDSPPSACCALLQTTPSIVAFYAERKEVSKNQIGCGLCICNMTLVVASFNIAGNSVVGCKWGRFWRSLREASKYLLVATCTLFQHVTVSRQLTAARRELLKIELNSLKQP